MDSSAPTILPILPPQVRVPSKPSTLLSFLVFLLYFLSCEKDKNKQKKRTGLAYFFKKITLVNYSLGLWWTHIVNLRSCLVESVGIGYCLWHPSGQKQKKPFWHDFFTKLYIFKNCPIIDATPVVFLNKRLPDPRVRFRPCKWLRMIFFLTSWPPPGMARSLTERFHRCLKERFNNSLLRA